MLSDWTKAAGLIIEFKVNLITEVDVTSYAWLNSPVNSISFEFILTFGVSVLIRAPFSSNSTVAIMLSLGISEIKGNLNLNKPPYGILLSGRKWILYILGSAAV